MSYYQTIYNRLRKGGLTEAAALAMLGNWQAESGCEPYRLQGDFDSFRTVSKVYTQRIQNGSMSRYEFGSDQKGYGLAQWTFVNPAKTAGRKYDLYDFWKNRGGNIDDVLLQTDFALWELTNTIYSSIMYSLRTGTDLYQLTKLICTQFEQPAINNIDVRYNNAVNIKSQIDLNGSDDPDDSVEPDEPLERFWPPKRMICQGMTGADVSIAKAILYALGWYEYDEGEDVDYFGQSLKEATIKFQRNNGLAPDGIIGPLTWAALLKM